METPRNSDNYDISIHALHEESDQRHRRRRPVLDNFNPRSP